ncbi:DNA polymerase Y family protein [Actinotalea caeni]|uniref:DNA polymerase Y family protein n=1 Tax=Actinotalea caeni TaxID=1348467 RepID=UPI001F038BAB|nr:DNA polymerase Y family protein [Actinotalea caeni]
MSAVTSMPPVAPQERGRTAEQATRLAVLWVPDWPVVAAVSEGLAEAHLPVALHDGRGLVAVSAQARAEGVRRGMRRRTAQGVCPELVLVAADEGRDVRAFEPVMQALEEVAPDVLLLRPGVAVLPARGPVRYLGSEAALAESLVGAAAEVGAEAQVGLADGVLAAMLAAREQVHVPPGRSAEFLARRDVRDLVHVTTTRDSRARLVELVDLFRRLGLATLGDVARLRPAHVGPRFGALGLQAHRLAQGLDAQPPQVRRAEPDITVQADLDPPAHRVDAAAFAARRLAEELQTSMLRRGVVCARLRVHARTEDGGSLERSWRLDGGALTAAELTDRVRWQLEGWLSGRNGQRPSAPLTFLELAAEEVSPAAAVSDGLWGRHGRGQAQAGRAALRVQGLIGADAVLAPVLQGGRSPRDRVRLVAWGDEPVALRDPRAPWPGQIPSPLPATVPATPVPARVLDDDGTPVVVADRGVLHGMPARVEVHRRRYEVTGWAGPWPVHERWWAGGRPRTYVQVVCGEIALLLAGEGDSWWVEGVYD